MYELQVTSLFFLSSTQSSVSFLLCFTSSLFIFVDFLIPFLHGECIGLVTLSPRSTLDKCGSCCPFFFFILTFFNLLYLLGHHFLFKLLEG